MGNISYLISHKTLFIHLECVYAHIILSLALHATVCSFVHILKIEFTFSCCSTGAAVVVVDFLLPCKQYIPPLNVNHIIYYLSNKWFE